MLFEILWIIKCLIHVFATNEQKLALSTGYSKPIWTMLTCALVYADRIDFLFSSGLYFEMFVLAYNMPHIPEYYLMMGFIASQFLTTYLYVRWIKRGWNSIMCYVGDVGGSYMFTVIVIWLTVFDNYIYLVIFILALILIEYILARKLPHMPYEIHIMSSILGLIVIYTQFDLQSCIIFQENYMKSMNIIRLKLITMGFITGIIYKLDVNLEPYRLPINKGRNCDD